MYLYLFIPIVFYYFTCYKIKTGFTSFKHLNLLVTWYSFKTISMVTCSLDYTTTGTSPLEGNTGFVCLIR